MALGEERKLEVRHALLAHFAELDDDDAQNIDELRAEPVVAEVIGDLADSTIDEVLAELVDEGNLTNPIPGRTDVWARPDADEPSDDEIEAEERHEERKALGTPGDGPDDELTPIGDDWIRLPAVGDGKALAVIELDAAIVSALALIHPAERAVICAQIEGAVRNVLRETRRLMPSREVGGEFELVDYAELVVGAGGEPA